MIKGKPQAFIRNLFEGIEKLRVDPASKRLTGMISKQGEVVPFKAPVESIGQNPERWLKELEYMMCVTLKNQIFNCYEDMDLD